MRLVPFLSTQPNWNEWLPVRSPSISINFLLIHGSTSRLRFWVSVIVHDTKMRLLAIIYFLLFFHKLRVCFFFYQQGRGWLENVHTWISPAKFGCLWVTNGNLTQSFKFVLGNFALKQIMYVFTLSLEQMHISDSNCVQWMKESPQKTLNVRSIEHQGIPLRSLEWNRHAKETINLLLASGREGMQSDKEIQQRGIIVSGIWVAIRYAMHGNACFYIDHWQTQDAKKKYCV